MNPSLLPSLAWFVHVAQHRSFTKAAEEMGITRAALSQNLKALEKQLGVALLYRTTRDMSLTEAGQQLFDALQPALGNIQNAVRSVGDASGTPSGLIRLNTSRMAAKALIEPHLAEFYTRYPKLRLELVMAEPLSNIVADGCDAGIRLGRSLAEHVVAVPITPTLSMAVVGAPAYFARHGVPTTPDDLVHHNCINYRYSGSGAVHDWDFNERGKHGQHFTQAVTGNLITNDDEGMTRAALNGLGLIQNIDIAVQRYLTEGRLVRVLREFTHTQAGFYLYVPTREQMPSKMRALMDFLVEKREEIVLG
ncbi:LysR family transcriptional regulator [Luteibacter aegosomatissinici]|uniref:LysR family transcriptional regulator n=1 Tax=Luteibacter aegosomatissinici TaxID=2911539 RepID=UPI001FF82213|nr:LysR family transcriptional regulator [Luteibacter aegosomatissinici]UPG93880.1 LysR family transcriptional regulator [Luteibacter aegosomatissinici]